jgi:hypothetical protein
VHVTKCTYFEGRTASSIRARQEYIEEILRYRDKSEDAPARRLAGMQCVDYEYLALCQLQLERIASLEISIKLPC